jgi:hypothetical protein
MLKTFMDQISGKGDLNTSSLNSATLIQKQLGTAMPRNLSGLNFKK